MQCRKQEMHANSRKLFAGQFKNTSLGLGKTSLEDLRVCVHLVAANIGPANSIMHNAGKEMRVNSRKLLPANSGLQVGFREDYFSVLSSYSCVSKCNNA